MLASEGLLPVDGSVNETRIAPMPTSRNTKLALYKIIIIKKHRNIPPKGPCIRYFQKGGGVFAPLS